MRLVEIIRRPDDVERKIVTTFLDDVAVDLGRRPLSDHLWLDLTGGGDPGFVGVRTADADRTLGYAQVSAANDAATLEVVVADPEPLDRQVRRDLVDTAIDAFRRDGGGRLRWWIDDPDELDQSLAEQHGLAPERSIHEMRRRLPGPDRATVETRPFRPGLDDDAWLAVNNRAFADHGEQGGWTQATLARRVAEPWFDADGFRLHDRDDRLAAFCWTKLHPADAPDRSPMIGEIYVIAVDPDFHGQGLGRQLTLAGLDSITERGITLANLWVDAGNAPAVGLYEQLGFTVHRTRHAVIGDLSPAT